MAYAISAAAGQRIERKMLITIATWGSDTNAGAAILGARVEDSSIEFNADVETTTDILGVNHTDINKTQPQQTFDPAYIIGGDKLMEYMTEAALTNNINAYNGAFDVYVVSAYLKDGSKYHCVKHKGCSIIPSSIGGESYLAMPFEVFYSNDIVPGSVTSIAKEDLMDIATKFVADSAA